MRQDPVSLFEVRPSRAQLGVAIAIPLLLAASLLVFLAIGDRRLPEYPAVIPIVDSILLLAHLVTATLLFAQAAVFRTRALVALGAAYLFMAFVVIAHLLTFPGAFSPTGLLGARHDSATWIYAFWAVGFLVGVLAYAGFDRADAKVPIRLRHPGQAIFVGCLAAAGLALALTTLALKGADFLPALMVGATGLQSHNIAVLTVSMVCCALVAIRLLWRPQYSLLDMWLLVALSSWLVQTLFVVATTGRFTLLWYASEAESLVPRLVVMFGLLAETHKIYARMAVAMIAQQHERERRLMSMDAIAAAIAHEVRQPLAAMVANACAALRWLNRLGPNSELISRPLSSVIAEGHRAGDVIESICAIFAQREGERVALDVNQLVRETASLMVMEFAVEDVSLRLDLDDRVPAIVADRTQLQQVLVNLFTNSVEALAETSGRERRLAVRSARVESDAVLVEVTDCGIGIPAEQVDQLFDPFFTTKKRGVGVGLSLCRSIVESHGGRLWASPGDSGGATFHLQLPQPRLAA